MSIKRSPSLGEASSVTRLQKRAELSRIVVLVDDGAISRRTLEMAIRLARTEPNGSWQIVLVALVPGAEPLGPYGREEASAGAVSAAGGPGTARATLADEETAAGAVLRLLLVPMQRRVEATGLTAELHILRGPDAGAQLRALLAGGAGDRVLVLSHPLQLHGPLRALTEDLLAAQPCSTYLLSGPGERRPDRSTKGGSLLARVLRRLTRRAGGSRG